MFSKRAVQIWVGLELAGPPCNVLIAKLLKLCPSLSASWASQVSKIVIDDDDRRFTHGVVSEGFSAEALQKFCRNLQNIRFIASGKSVEFLRKVCGNVAEVFRQIRSLQRPLPEPQLLRCPTAEAMPNPTQNQEWSSPNPPPGQQLPSRVIVEDVCGAGVFRVAAFVCPVSVHLVASKHRIVLRPGVPATKDCLLLWRFEYVACLAFDLCVFGSIPVMGGPRVSSVLWSEARLRSGRLMGPANPLCSVPHRLFVCQTFRFLFGQIQSSWGKHACRFKFAPCLFSDLVVYLPCFQDG